MRAHQNELADPDWLTTDLAAAADPAAHGEPALYSLGDESEGDWEIASAAPAAVAPASVTSSRTAGDALVPRISIEAFCDRETVAERMRLAGRDRRLAKASLRVETGGVAAARARLSGEVTPNLLVLDCASPPQVLLQELESLAPLVDVHTKVIVIGAFNDIALYRELIRRGVSEYLVAPLEPLQLIDAIAALYVDPERPFVGRLLAVAGVRGGVGSSTIAHNLAYAFAERYALATTLVDLDLSFGTVSLDFNQDAAGGLAEALAAPDRVDEVFLERLLVRQTDRLSLLPSPADLEKARPFDAAACETVLERVRRVSPFVVADLPHVWADWVKQTLLSASDVVLVATPDLAALRNCKHMVDLLRAARPHDPPPTIVLNQVGAPKRPEVSPKDFGDTLNVEPAAVVPFDPAVFGAAGNSGQMLFESAPSSKPALALEGLAARLSGRDTPVVRAKRTLLSSLLKR